jgi:hypothetical protein
MTVVSGAASGQREPPRHGSGAPHTATIDAAPALQRRSGGLSSTGTAS